MKSEHTQTHTLTFTHTRTRIAVQTMAADRSAQRVQLISDAKDDVYGIHMQMLPNRKELILVTGSRDKKVYVYSSAVTHSIPHFTLRSHVQHQSSVGVVQLNKDCTSVLSGDDGGELILSDVRNISNPKRITVLKHPKGVVGACWSSTGNAIITLCGDNIIRIFDLHNKDIPCQEYKVPSKGKMRSMVCSGSSIVVGDSDGWLFVSTLQDPSRVVRKIQAHHNIGWHNGFDVLADGIFVSASWWDHSVSVWDMKSNKTEKIKHPKCVYAVHVPLKGGHMFFSACADNYVRVFDRKSNATRELFKVKTKSAPSSVTSCAIPGQQGGLFAIGCRDGGCEVYRCLSLPVDKVRWAELICM